MSDRGAKLQRSTASISDPCKLRILVAPVGQITRREFYKYLSLISEYAIVEVDQLIKSNHQMRPRLEKLLYRSGRIHLNFVTEHTPGSHSDLDGFQYFRRVLGVLGVMDCEQGEDLEKCHDQFLAKNKKFSTCVSQRCFAFRANEGTSIEGVTMVPERADMDFYIQISMMEFISQIVGFLCDEAEQILTKSNSFLSGWNLPAQPSHSSTSPKTHTRNTSIQKELSSRVYDLASSVGLGTDQKTKKQLQGRQTKLAADLYLMAGRYPEAVKMYLKAIDQTRANVDNLFYIGSLEGYCCTLLLVSSIKEDLASFSYKGDPEELLLTIADSYVKELIRMYENSSHPLLYTESYLKFAKLLTVIWKLGTSKTAIEACIGDDFDTSEGAAILNLKNPEHRQWVCRPFITAWLMSAWKPASKYLTAPDKMSLFSAIAAIFGSLGYKRKQAFFLRQSALLLLPKLTQNGSQRDQPLLTENEDTIRVCLTRVCQGYGIEPNLGAPGNPEFKELKYANVYPKHQGWVVLQKTVYKECIALWEAISDFLTMGRYILHMLLHLYPYLTKSEQEENAQTLLYLVQCHALHLSQLDLSATLPGLVLFEGFRIEGSREFYPLEAESPKSSQPTPLMFSFKKDEPILKSEILVVGEAAQVELLFSNPFRFPLELDDMQLMVQGVKVDHHNTSCTIPPKGSIRWQSTITPLSSGTLDILGLQVRFLGCIYQDFMWPTVSKEVLSPQPFLKIARASLAQPSLMLFEGERTSFTFTLFNEGPVAADSVEVDGPLEWVNPGKISIQPNEECTLEFQAFGKAPSSQGIVMVNYASVAGGNCRRKFYHVNLSVYPALAAVDFDVLNAPLTFVPDLLVQSLKKAGIVDIQRQFCLVAIGLKNTSSSTIDVSFDVDLGNEYRHVVTESIAPLEAKRVFIPFRRLPIKEEASEKSAQEISIKRQLLEKLSVTWAMSGGRHGAFSLDWVSIPESARPILQLEEVWLHTRLETEDGATKINPFHYRCHLGKLVKLAVVLNNHRPMPITPCIRIQPYLDYHNGHFDILGGSLDSALTPATPLLVLGRSQEIFGEVPPHSSTQYTFEILPSGTGQFRIGCSCQDLSDLLAPKSSSSNQTIDSIPLFLDVAPLVVDIVDPSPA